MAVPSSGILRLASIRNELENNVYEVTYTANATSLTSASTGTYGTINTANSSSDRPDGSTPHAMSEFYSYNHDEVGVTSFTSAVAEVSIGCSQPLNQTYYHDGSGARPVDNDTVYTNSGGTSKLGNGVYRLDNNTKFTITGFAGTGVVDSVDDC